jgi:prepilin-type N-terminal cleavage/methylation domain-containing protein
MRTRKGLTLVEVLIVIGLVALVIAFLAPLVLKQQRDRDRMLTICNLKQLAYAAHTYHDSFRRLPPAHNGQQTCHILLAPYYEKNYGVLFDPSDDSFPEAQNTDFPWTSYAANYYLFGSQNDATEDITESPSFRGLQDPIGPNAPFGYSPLALDEIRDGRSNTIMWVTCLARPLGKDVVALGEASKPGQSTGPFTAWLNWEHQPSSATATVSSGRHAQSFYEVGIQVGLADGGARTIARRDARTIYAKAMLPNDNTLPDWDY